MQGGREPPTVNPLLGLFNPHFHKPMPSQISLIGGVITSTILLFAIPTTSSSVDLVIFHFSRTSYFLPVANLLSQGQKGTDNNDI